MLEVLYCTGMRRAEMLGLTLPDIDPQAGLVRINKGKGARDRVVPIGPRALQWLTRYLLEVRPCWTTPRTGAALFITNRGTALSPNHASHIAKRAVDQAGVGKSGSCHLFRHSCATVLLQNGADIRSIQQLLGHASLETTQLYTQVTVVDLKRVHARCHPLGNPNTAAAEANGVAPLAHTHHPLA